MEEPSNFRTVQQDATLHRDVEAVFAQKRKLDAWSDAYDAERVAGIVTAAPSSENYLPESIPSAIAQIADTGRYADLVIGLNNGYRCDDVIESFTKFPKTEIIRLYTTKKLNEDTPGILYDDPQAQGSPYRIAQQSKQHRIFVVHQAASPYSAGKTRMLADIVNSLFLSNMEAGWRPPIYLALFDAESLFFLHPADRDLTEEMETIQKLLANSNDLREVIQTLILRQFSKPPSQTPRPKLDAGLELGGLTRLIRELDDDPQIDLLGALTHFCVFNDEQVINNVKALMPDLAAPISAMHLIYNYTCGWLDGCICLPGGGTLGRVNVLLSLLAAILKTYPHIYGEDAITTVLADSAGFHSRLVDHVFVTNRCPAPGERSSQAGHEAWKQQFVNWYRGFDAVEQLYGRHNAASVLGPTADMFVTASLAIFARTLKETQDVASSLKLLETFIECKPAYDEIRHLAALPVSK